MKLNILKKVIVIVSTHWKLMKIMSNYLFLQTES